MKFDNRFDLTFASEDEAFEYWQEAVWYGSGEGYESFGRCFDDQVDIFKDWLEYNAISWTEV